MLWQCAAVSLRVTLMLHQDVRVWGCDWNARGQLEGRALWCCVVWAISTPEEARFRLSKPNSDDVSSWNVCRICTFVLCREEKPLTLEVIHSACKNREGRNKPANVSVSHERKQMSCVWSRECSGSCLSCGIYQRLFSSVIDGVFWKVTDLAGCSILLRRHFLSLWTYITIPHTQR